MSECVYIYIYIHTFFHIYLEGCALLPPAPFSNFVVLKYTEAGWVQGINHCANKWKHKLNSYERCVLFSLILWFFGCRFLTFSGSGPRFGGKGKPGSEQNAKRKKNSQKRSPKWEIRNLCFLQLLFYWFLEQSWEVIFSALVAEVSQMRATWGDFSSHVAATLESWKLWFRVHQT